MPEEPHSWTDFGELPKGTFIVDHRQDPKKPKIIKVIGGEVPVISDDPPPADIDEDRVAPKTRLWLLILNVSIVLALAAAWWVKRFQRKHQSQ